jgi:hypothetical protein
MNPQGSVQTTLWYPNKNVRVNIYNVLPGGGEGPGEPRAGGDTTATHHNHSVWNVKVAGGERAQGTSNTMNKSSTISIM